MKNRSPYLKGNQRHGGSILKFLLLAVVIVASGSAANAQLSMSRLNIQLLLTTGGNSSDVADGCVLVYNNSFIKGLGPEDSYKFNNLDENLAIDCGGTLLSIEGRPDFADFDTVPLKIWQYRQSHYYLSFTGSNFSPTVVAVLKDNYLHTDSPIDLDGPTLIDYNITSDSASFAADRFCIVFKPASALASSFITLAADSRYDGVQLSWTVKTEKQTDRYEIERSEDGVTFKSVGILKENDRSWKDNGNDCVIKYYRLKVYAKDGTTSYSNVVKAASKKGSGSFSVFPNPLRTNAVAVHMLNMEKGNYEARLVSSCGETVFAKSITYDGGSEIRYLAIEKELAKGVYQLILTTGKTIKSQAVLVQ